MAVKEEEVDAGVWRKVAVMASIGLETVPARRRTPRLRGHGVAVKEEEVDAGMWRKVAVGSSERRVMEVMAGVGVERACAAVEARGGGGDRRRRTTSGCPCAQESNRPHMSARFLREMDGDILRYRTSQEK
jgi:hypothetical protein